MTRDSHICSDAPVAAPIRVLQVSRWLCASGGGGIQSYIAALAHALHSRAVHLRYAALLPGTVPEYAADAWHGDEGSPKWFNAWRFWRWLTYALNDTDLVHIHGVTDWHFLVAALVCRRRGIPYVITAHGGLFAAALSQTRMRRIKSGLYLKWCAGPLIEGAAAAIASTPKEARALRKVKGSLDVRICPPAIEVPDTPCAFDVDREDAAGLRVLFVGRLEQIKSLPVLLKAVAILRGRDVDVRLDMVGAGATDYRERLERMTTELGITAVTAWHGYLAGDAKSAVMRQSHVLVLPSFSENFGFTVAEAMAAGLPVVVSDGVGLADVVERAGAGTVFPVGNPESLAVSLAEYADASIRRERGLKAHEAARREFSLETCGCALERIYREVTHVEATETVPSDG